MREWQRLTEKVKESKETKAKTRYRKRKNRMFHNGITVMIDMESQVVVNSFITMRQD